MRAYGDIRLIIFRIGPFRLETRTITLAEWPADEQRCWKALAIDPSDDVAFTFWRDQGAAPLRTLI